MSDNTLENSFVEGISLVTILANVSKRNINSSNNNVKEYMSKGNRHFGLLGKNLASNEINKFVYGVKKIMNNIAPNRLNKT